MWSAFLIEIFDRGGDSTVEFVDRSERLMGKEVALQIAPGSLDVIEFGGVFGQPLDCQPGALFKCGPGQLAGVDRAVVEDEDDRLGSLIRSRPIERIEALQQGDEIAAALGAAGVNDQLAGGMIESAEERKLVRLTGRRHPEIGASLCPGMSQIRVGERLGFIGKQQADIASLGLLSEQLQPQPSIINRLSGGSGSGGVGAIGTPLF